MSRRLLLHLVLVLSVCVTASAQHLRLPQSSPAASVEETFGVTDVRVSYHRPSVKGRVIFGGLVPYDVVWRAGANQPTLITFSTPVKVEGQPVDAGTYSFYLIPARDQWTVVLNRFTGGWGTYSYDASEDALRAKVTPQPAEMQERLAYSFEDAKPESITLSMRWDKLRVPVKLEADTTKLAADGIRNQLRSELHWVPQAWTEAAQYAFGHGDTDAALAYVDRAVELLPDAQSLRLKAAIVEKKGDAQAAQALRARADSFTSPEMASISAAYRLIRQKKYDEAISSLGDAKSWRAMNAIGDAWAGKGDKVKAMEWYGKAMSAARDQSERVEVQDSINALGAS